MKILVLGGTSFVGRAIVDDALAEGHDLTLFSRGKTGRELFPNVPRLTGDRDAGDYTSLLGGTWDAVVDVSAYVPRHIAQAADTLADRTSRYLLISTGSVYDRSAAVPGLTEDSQRLAPERGTEQITGDTYGPLKVACEDDVLGRFGDRSTIVRPGIVAGPYDPTDRFTYWVRRAALGGRVALPGRPDQPVQVVDSRDLARLVVQLLSDDRAGTFNAVGPATATTMHELIETAARAAGTTAHVIPVGPTAAGLGCPLVLDDAASDVHFQRSAAAARLVGLSATPLQQTAADVLAWDRERGEPALTGGGLSAAQEADLLDQAGS